MGLAVRSVRQASVAGFLCGSLLTLLISEVARASLRTTRDGQTRSPPDLNFKESAALPEDMLARLPDTAAPLPEAQWTVPRIVPTEANPLFMIFNDHNRGPLIHKWYFQRYKSQTLNLLEIGVQSGGTVSMWQQYFGEGLTYYGADINPYCKEMFGDLPRVNIFVGDQGSREFWAEIRALDVKFDIIIDDGGHTMQQQIVTYEETWDMLQEGGIYLCEDTSTSMDSVTGFALPPSPQASYGPLIPTHQRWGGGYKNPNSWLEYSKQFVDIVHGHYVNRTAHPNFDPLQRASSMLSYAAYDQMIVMEKGVHPVPPMAVKRGNFQLPGHVTPDVSRDLLVKYRADLAAAEKA